MVQLNRSHPATWPGIVTLLAAILAIAGSTAETNSETQPAPAILSANAGLASNASKNPGKKHALLVGVTYAKREDIPTLPGPINDVRSFNALLLERGFDRNAIHILSDGIDGAIQPTRQAIVDAFDNLAKTLTRDDFVFLYFGGHGSYQPALDDPSETDGLDEIFLPVDVGRWQGQEGPVENAITDNEMSHLLALLRNRGAFVWAVFDQCHAGTMTRDESAGESYRYVDPTLLGAPVSALASSHSVRGTRGALENSQILEPAPDLAADAGPAVLFYATQPWEIEPEVELPNGDQAKQSFGLFSSQLLQVLSAYPGASYFQIGQQVLQHYDAMGRTRPTPLFTGSGTEAAVFGGQSGEIIRQWPVKRNEQGLFVEAGKLHQLSEGSILAVVASPAAKEAMGYLSVKQAGLFRSLLAAIPYRDKTPLEPPRKSFARLLSVNPALTLRIASFQPEKEKDIAAARKVHKAIERIKSEGAGALLEWVAEGQEADLFLRARDSRVWLAPSGSAGIGKDGPYQTHSIRLDTSDQNLYTLLTDSLRRIAKARNLLRLTSEFNDSVLTHKLDINASVQRAGSQNAQTFRADTLPRLGEGDLITLTLENRHKKPVDVTMLFMDSQYGIKVWYPQSDQVNRIDTGGKITKRILVETNTLGRERMLFIAVEAGHLSPLASDFRFLAQDTLPKTRGESATAPSSDDQRQLYALFERAGFGAESRSGVGEDSPASGLTQSAAQRTLMTTYGWVVE